MIRAASTNQLGWELCGVVHESALCGVFVSSHVLLAWDAYVHHTKESVVVGCCRFLGAGKGEGVCQGVRLRKVYTGETVLQFLGF